MKLELEVTKEQAILLYCMISVCSNIISSDKLRGAIRSLESASSTEDPDSFKDAIVIPIRNLLEL